MGAHRWGHVSDQFDNPFSATTAAASWKPVLQQMEEYLACGERFEVLGVVGVDGSPSCGVDYTCTADWYGSFDGRQGLDDTLASCQLVRRPGVFMRVLTEMLAERGWQDRVIVRSLLLRNRRNAWVFCRQIKQDVQYLVVLFDLIVSCAEACKKMPIVTYFAKSVWILWTNIYWIAWTKC